MENSITTRTFLREYRNSYNGGLGKEGICCGIPPFLLNLRSCWYSHFRCTSTPITRLRV